MKRLAAVLFSGALLSVLLVAPVDAKATGAERQPVQAQYDGTDDNGLPAGVEGEEGMPGAPGDGDVVGWSNLVRRDGGIGATLKLDGLVPGGVYTVWIVVPGQPETCGGPLCEVFVARGAGFIAKSNGKATVHVAADVGDDSITGFFLDFTDELVDTMDVPVIFEIAYHGQADDDGFDQSWLENFWDGADPEICPGPFDPNPIDGLPHCPISLRSFHVPS